MNRHPKANNLRQRPQITQPADPSYRIIALTQGQVTLVDTEDYDRLMQWHWLRLVEYARQKILRGSHDDL